ncbi:hypothetical protein CWATWH0005_4533 [Crocosphaera watsonii WH 0005]|uniref:Uncharacterized protein n=1 Tax=Crocosphaera watsonii WH 0005 TaxID=423472 RepID=T2IUV6_CROWT|nr:hypothetical protein CWATWH0005_4533 [Crocosphaera watsonii WH 0005]
MWEVNQFSINVFFNIKMDVSFWVYFRCLKVPVIVSAGKLNH